MSDQKWTAEDWRRAVAEMETQGCSGHLQVDPYRTGIYFWLDKKSKTLAREGWLESAQVKLFLGEDGELLEIHISGGKWFRERKRDDATRPNRTGTV